MIDLDGATCGYAASPALNAALAQHVTTYLERRLLVLARETYERRLSVLPFLTFSCGRYGNEPWREVVDGHTSYRQRSAAVTGEPQTAPNCATP